MHDRLCVGVLIFDDKRLMHFDGGQKVMKCKDETTV